MQVQQGLGGELADVVMATSVGHELVGGNICGLWKSCVVPSRVSPLSYDVTAE